MIGRRGFIGVLAGAFVAVALEVLPSSAPFIPSLPPPTMTLLERQIVDMLEMVYRSTPRPDRIVVGPLMYAELKKAGLL